MEETPAQARDRGYNDGVTGKTPKHEDVNNDAYKDGYQLGFIVYIGDLLK